MSSGCGDVVSLESMQIARKHQIFEAEVITGKSGGVAGGADIDYATNEVTGQVQKTLPAVIRDTGFRPASFTFATGGTLAIGDSDMAVLWPISSGGDGQYYFWKGLLPKTIPASSTPASTGGVSSSAWLPLGDITLRSDLISSYNAKGDALITVKHTFTGAAQRTQHLKNAEVVSTDDAAALSDIFASGATSVRCLGKSYTIASALTVPATVRLDVTPGFGITGATVTNNGLPIAKGVYSANVPYSIGSQVITSDGNEFVCIAPSHNSPPATNPSKWQATVIKSAITLAVPSVFTDLNVAYSFLAKAVISAEVTISCASHSSGSVTFNHPYGSKITIDGGTRSTVINFGVNDGIAVDGPFKLNIKNITLTGTNWTSHGVWTKVATGIFAISGAFVNCDNVFITKIYYGFHSSRGGSIYANNCEASEAGDGGFFAFNGGHIEAVNPSSHDNYDSGLVGQLGYGFVAENGGTMWLRTPSSYGCPAGIFANIGANIRADNVNLTGNNNGVLIKAGGVVEVYGGTINSNISDNVYCVSSTYSAINANHNSSQNGTGLVVAGGSVANTNSCTFNGNKIYGQQALLGSVIKNNASVTATGNLVGSYSPAYNTIGNNNSIIAD